MPGWIPRRPSGDSAEAKYQQWIHDTKVREDKQVFVSGQRTANTTSGKVTIAGGGRRRGAGASVFTFVLLYAEANHLVCREATLETLESGKVKIASIGAEDIYVAKPADLRCFDTTIPIWADDSGPVWSGATLEHTEDESEPLMVFTDSIVFPDADTRPPAGEDGKNAFGEAAGDYGSGGSRENLRLNRIRTVTADGIEEEQRVIPAWRKGEIIYASELEEPQTTAEGEITEAGQSIDYIMVGDGRQWARI